MKSFLSIRGANLNNLTNKSSRMCQNNRIVTKSKTCLRSKSSSSSPFSNKFVHSAQPTPSIDIKDFSQMIKEGPSLGHFISGNTNSQPENSTDSSLSQSEEDLISNEEKIPYLEMDLKTIGRGRKVFIETYGCQMNVSDTEIVKSIMLDSGFIETNNEKEANVIFLNTCAIREKAESKVWDRLKEIAAMKRDGKKHDLMVGVLGCMAERLKTSILETQKLVDIVVGPDAYRDLPRLVARVEQLDEPSVNVLLSQDETYADVTPVRTSSNGITGFVSITRGCNNMCTYCIVPYTRGRERSRPVHSILEEVRDLSQRGFKEVMLLGQNVNSYNYIDEEVNSQSNEMRKLAEGFSTIYKNGKAGVTFTNLLDQVSKIDPNMRIRFTSPHPKDFSDDLIELIAQRPNICKSLHLPAQSGSTTVLERMKRGYSRESYDKLIQNIKKTMPGTAISSDFIAGFCGETEEEHKDTISLLKSVQYEHAFMFAYSLREKTKAHRLYVDDVPQPVKIERVSEVIKTFYDNSKLKNEEEIGREHLVLIEGTSRRSKEEMAGRSDTNKKVIVPNFEIPNGLMGDNPASQTKSTIKPGDYVVVKIDSARSYSLRGVPIAKSSVTEYERYKLINEMAFPPIPPTNKLNL
eukprot:TRINITY_DN4336_c0_g2_i1.p1 TRINITY_DN4336_c0_g2~~TRINITY_DN4336_c0_g2_i1.p1  ORF type:complete len:670 (+),score=236.89 TRINITY_DN4336_c0_g2_i1:109-2010(+)